MVVTLLGFEGWRGDSGGAFLALKGGGDAADERLGGVNFEAQGFEVNMLR
jgi:hypothetical protein